MGAATLASDLYRLAEFHAIDHLAVLLGIEALDTRGGVREMAIEAGETRAQVITLRSRGGDGSPAG
ncbi:hypothetical protein ACFYVR_24855 [Rhodococcus sp. NPDC003318]|uniref:hypothetical protein n=1 Tax=Rhodococcus sp. NPDC003318 TaxID=3364503 RepID=UPI0036C6D159